MLPLIPGNYLDAINELLEKVYGVSDLIKFKRDIEPVCSNDCYLYRTVYADVYLKRIEFGEGSEVLAGLLVGKPRGVFSLSNEAILGGTNPNFSSELDEYAYGIIDGESFDMNFFQLSKRAGTLRFFKQEGTIVRDIGGFMILPDQEGWEALVDEGVFDLQSVTLGGNTYSGVTLPDVPFNFVGGKFSGLIIRDIGGF